MTIAIIITICVLLLLGYVFDFTSAKTKIPSVILLLLLGLVVRHLSQIMEISIPNLSPVLPFLGTIGLILIVLEGSLELELNKSKLPKIAKYSAIALIPMLVFSFGLAYAFQQFSDSTFKICLSNAIPFSIISSAIAIPSARNLLNHEKEFVTYESSLSDIFGVLLFNFLTLNDNIGSQSIGYFALELIIMIGVSFVATLVLAYLLHKIKHHIKFAPIIILILLIYAVSKVYHLPALIFILFFGLFIGNIDELRNYKFIQQFHPINFSKEVLKFRELTTEMAFLIRTLFFLLFGYLIEITEIMNADTIIWALLITVGIFLVRLLVLKLFKFPSGPVLLIAPRGLITILLFLSIPFEQTIQIANKSLIIQVIILTAFVMMIGLIRQNKSDTDPIKIDDSKEII